MSTTGSSPDESDAGGGSLALRLGAVGVAEAAGAVFASFFGPPRCLVQG